MAIRSFANVPCGPCGKDTTHYAMRCRECGAIVETPSEARARVRKQLFAKGGSYLYYKARAAQTKARHDEQAMIPFHRFGGAK